MNKDKQEVLLINHGYEKCEGFVMDYDKPEDDNLLDIFITKEEWFKKGLEGIQTYYWNGRSERLMTLEDAWENLLEDLWFNSKYESEAQVIDNLEIEYANIVNKMNKNENGV